MKNLLLSASFLFGSWVVFGQQTSNESIMMRVAAHKVNCHTTSSNVCFQVQKGASIGTDFWEPLQQDLKNFQYEEGYQYDVSVKISSTMPDSQGKRNVVYEVIKVNDKKKVTE